MGAHLLYFYLHGSIIEKLCLLICLDLIWNYFEFVFFFLYQIGLVQWNFGYSKENNILIFSCCCLHCNNNTNILYTYWIIQLTFVNIGLYSSFTNSWICQIFYSYESFERSLHASDKVLATNSYSPCNYFFTVYSVTFVLSLLIVQKMIAAWN